jgi:hypothetical protein
MGLRHFLLTIPLSSVILTVLFFYMVPAFSIQLRWEQMLAMITAVNITVTVLAVLLIKDRKKRGPT